MEKIGKSRKSQILIKIIHLWSSDIQIKNQGEREIEAGRQDLAEGTYFGQVSLGEEPVEGRTGMMSAFES